MALTETLIYAITICATFGALLLLRLIPIVARFFHNYLTLPLLSLTPVIKRLIQNHVTLFLLKKVVYPFMYRRFLFLTPITRLRALTLATYTAVTVILNLNGVHTEMQASTRAGWLSIANLIPLFVSGRVAMAANALGLSMREVFAVHAATGSMVVAQATAHIYLELRRSRFRLDSTIQFYGFLVALLVGIASIALAAILISLFARRPIFGLFKWAHAALAILLTVAVWKHPHPGRVQSRLYLIIAAAAYVLLIVTQAASVVFRNLLLSRRCARAYVKSYGTASRITLNFDRPFRVKPGQLLYVWIPAVSFRSLFQSYPFMVSWLETNTEKRTSSLAVLAQVHTGFTKRINDLATSPEPYLAWIDGPYGNPPDYGKYDSVIFVASGIGVTAHILAIRDLLEDCKECGTRTKSIWLYWQIDQESNQDLVKDWFTELLKEDNGQFHLRIIFSYTHRPSAPQKWGDYERVNKLFDNDALALQLSTTIDSAHGDVLVSVSAYNWLRDETRGFVNGSLRHGRLLNYHESDFQPAKRGRLFSWLRRRV